jgi:hypothetical protein
MIMFISFNNCMYIYYVMCTSHMRYVFMYLFMYVFIMYVYNYKDAPTCDI